MKTKMIRRAILGAVLLVVIFGLVSACRSARRDEPIAGPLVLNDPVTEHGRVVFADRCHACHPGGAGGLGPALNNKPVPGFLMKTQVRAGIGAMPGFDKHSLSSDELDALTKYLLALRRHEAGEKGP
jgi:mono/diheme cytochrome c family protein